jgi:hypothetical protein
MAPGRTGRLQIPDARGGGASLRVTWHPAQRKVVFSHWRDGVCVATTPVHLAEVPRLISLLVSALGQAAVDPGSPMSGGRHGTVAEPGRGLVGMLRQWLRPKLAHILELGPVHGGPLHLRPAPDEPDGHDHRRAG